MTGASVLGSQLSASFREDLHWNQDLKALWKMQISLRVQSTCVALTEALGKFLPWGFFLGSVLSKQPKLCRDCQLA